MPISCGTVCARAASPAPAYATPLDNAIELDGAFEIFEWPRAQILNHEHSGNQVMNRGGDQDGIGSGCALDVRSDVGYGAENIRFAIRAVADDDRAAMDTDAYGELPIVRPKELGVQCCNRFN